ncbi:MAG: D-alanyl-D-alanine carboxypeptidase [Clostridia bacterium]|nr:D-alanyl-D-alanine carboxypeptidase [Clostridia bacterium]
MKKLLSVLSVLLIVLSLCSFSVNAENVNSEAILTVNTEMQVEVNAKACVLMDANTGTLLMGFNENEKLYPASVTKIMTLLLVCEAIESGKLTLEMEITCSESAAAKGGSQIWLEPGEVMTVHELLKATVIYSANDACCLLGESVAGDEIAFCELMNKRAKELGMNNTHFVNCTGLDDDVDDHKTTAFDIAIMSRELLKHELIRNYTTIWMDSLRNGETQLVNTNKIIRTYPGATGLKTGTTSKAGCCVSATAERDGLELIAVILGADNSKDRFSAAQKLLDWGFANYEIYSLNPENTYPGSIKVTHGVKQELNVTHSEAGEVLINKGAADRIVSEVEIAEEIEAPVTKGQNVGYVTFKVDGDIIGKCELTADENIENMTFKNAIKAIFSSLKNN